MVSYGLSVPFIQRILLQRVLNDISENDLISKIFVAQAKSDYFIDLEKVTRQSSPSEME